MADRVNILGVNVSAINMSQTLESIQSWIENRQANYICVTPAHGVMDCQRDHTLKKIFNRSGLTTPDGMSIVWLLRMKGYSQVERVYGPDLMLATCDRGLQFGWRHYFYGGNPGVAESLIEKLKNKYPSLEVAGSFSPPFRRLTNYEEESIIALIHKAEPDIIWVGLSTPKQEKWMAKFVNKLDAPVLIGVGAAYDFLSGTKKQAPLWMQKYGMEWLFRLITEPRRLWRRYAQYPLFALLVVSQLLGFKSFNNQWSNE